MNSGSPARAVAGMSDGLVAHPSPRALAIEGLPMKQGAAEVARQATARSVPSRNQHNALAASNNATAMPIDRCMPRMKACGSVSRSK